MPPLYVPPELGGTTQIGGHAKNFFRFCAPSFKTVSAPMPRLRITSRGKQAVQEAATICPRPL